MGGRIKLHLSNLGPIKHGEIELGDITLFVGKPNTGKSLAMRAIYQHLKERGIKNIIYLHQLRFINAFLNDNKYNEKIYNLLKPLLKGEIKYIDGELVYVEKDKIIPLGRVSASILEILSFLLSVKEGSIILYEEPETHLHEELQLLMGIALYALSSFNRIVITTHSQTIFYTIAHLSMLRPTKEELKDLFEDLKVKDYEALMEAVEEANQKEVKVRIYHFTEGGEVKEVSVDEAVKGMPGTIDVLEKEFKWFSSLHSKRLFGEA